MTQSPNNGETAVSPGIGASRPYPGFGACIICGFDVDYFIFKPGITIIYHHGTHCVRRRFI